MIKAPARNPIVPSNKKDRTGTGGILRRAVADLAARFRGIEQDILAAFDRIPVYAINDLRTPEVRYGLTPEALAGIAEELQATLERWIGAGRDPEHFAWWHPYPEEAAQLGTAQSVANLANLSASYAAARNLATVVYSEPYRNRIAMAKFRSNEYWTGLSADTRAKLAEVIGRAVADGQNPRVARKAIQEALGVSKGRAMLYAQTDITNTLREARLAESEAAERDLGVRTALLWTSALLPTTRPWHASRNGKVYSREEVKAFYAQGGNRFRCFLPGTVVRGRFIAGVKSRYKGPAGRLVTAGGRELTVTANHPVLTARGMVPAAELRIGDQLIAYRDELKGSLGVGNLDGGLVGSRVEDVFGALVNVGHQFPARVRAIDLHGDARFCEPDVDVVWADGPLVFALDPTAAKLLDQFALVLADATAPAVGACDLLRKLDVPNPGSFIGASGVVAPLFRTHVCRPIELGLAHGASAAAGGVDRVSDGLALKAGALADGEDRLAGRVHLRPLKPAREASTSGPLSPPKAAAMHSFHDGSAAAPNAVGDVVNRFAGLAAFDELIDICWTEYEGHVYDLQELSGLMLGSNIVASNCHCGQTECLLDAEGKPILTKKLLSTMANEKKAWQSLYDAS